LGLSIHQIGKRYGNVVACADVSLDVQDGEFISLLGPSGCGKTTILRAIAGFVTLDAGRIFVNDLDITHLPPNKRNVGLVFQNYALWPHLTVFENLAFGLKIRGTRPPAIREIILGTLTLLGLRDLETRYPRELSGGQQQRVALARCLVLKPAILLLDEPLSNLDRKLRNQMRIELKKLQRRVGVTTLYVTHDQEEALSMSDRIVVLDHGHVVQVGSPEHIYESPQNPFVADFIGNVNMLDGQAVQRDGKSYFRVGDLEIEIPPGNVAAKSRLFFRPERVAILRGRSPEGFNLIPGQVLFRVYLGAAFRYEIDAGGIVITADSTNTGSPIQVGEKVFLEIKPEDCFLL